MGQELETLGSWLFIRKSRKLVGVLSRLFISALCITLLGISCLGVKGRHFTWVSEVSSSSVPSMCAYTPHWYVGRGFFDGS